MNTQSANSANIGDTIWDSAVKGLHLRVSPKGKKVFYLYYKTKQGKQRRPKLGEFKTQLSVAGAKKVARTLLLKIAQGEDPKGDWDIVREDITIDFLFEKTWEQHWSEDRFKKSGWAKEAKQNYLKNIKPRLGAMKLGELDAQTIRKWHTSLSAVPYCANRSLQVLSKMIGFSIEKQWTQKSNPCALVKPFREKKRKRYASRQELKLIIKALDNESSCSPGAVAFLWILIFSGSRPRAVERARWDQLREFISEGKTYGILSFDGKSSVATGQEEVVILPPVVMKILRGLPRDTDTITNCKMPTYLWSKIRKQVGCNDLWARDLRRTFASIGLSAGVNLDTVGELLNHQNTQTTKLYAKLMQDAGLKAVTKIADAITDLAYQ